MRRPQSPLCYQHRGSLRPSMACFSRARGPLLTPAGALARAPVDPLQVRAMGRDEVAQRVTAELLARRARELPGNGRLADDRERLDCGDVAPLDERLARLAGFQVDRG